VENVEVPTFLVRESAPTAQLVAGQVFYSTAMPKKKFYLFQSAAIFCDRISNWLFTMTIITIVAQWRYVIDIEMNKGLSIVPAILTIAAATILKVSYLLAVVRPKPINIKIWLFVIPGVLVLYLIKAALLIFINGLYTVFNNPRDNFFASMGLIQGSPADEDAIIQIVAILSIGYHLVMWLYMTGTLGTLWFYLKADYKRRTSTEATKKLAA